MKEVVLITGANGVIAKKLSERLKNEYEIRFLTRKKRSENEYEWDIHHGYVDAKALENVSHVIHLAGANISEKRWTAERKREIITSRAGAARLILDTLIKNNQSIRSFVSASGVGYYGATTNEKIYTETDEKGNDFISEVVDLWEKAADEFLQNNVANRVVKIRMGVVLSNQEGALQKMEKPIRYCVGSPLGKGYQYMHWIHIDDVCSVYEMAIRNPTIMGTYNACAPEHSTNRKFMETLAFVMKKPLLLPNVPEFIIQIIFGEMASIILEGSRVTPEKLQKEGFVFAFPNLKTTLEDLLENKA